MFTIREDILSLDYLRQKPDDDELMQRLLDEESFSIWDDTFVPDGRRMVNDAVKKATGATLGEIMGLIDILEEYESSITYDCLTLGFRLRLLGTQAFSWGELLAIVQNSPRISAFYRAQNPADWMWDETTQLLANIDHALRIANWQRSEGKEADFPEPIKRPGEESDDKQINSSALPMNEMADWLGDSFKLPGATEN